MAVPRSSRRRSIDTRNAAVVVAAIAAIIGLSLFGLTLYRAADRVEPAQLVEKDELPQPPPRPPVNAPPPRPRFNPRKKPSAPRAAARGPAKAVVEAPPPLLTPSPPSAAPPQPQDARPSAAESAPPGPPASETPTISESVEVDAKIYSSRDADVTPPIAILPQRLGMLPASERSTLMIEVVLDETGEVESARTSEQPMSLGDAQVVTMSLHAVKAWRFQPALRNGRPVRYRQTIPVSLR
jgi:hypothetical protein